MNSLPPIHRRAVLAGTLSAAVAAGCSTAGSRSAPMSSMSPAQAPGQGALELVRRMQCPSTPTGIAFSPSGRLFVFMPRFDAKVPYTVGEVDADGRVTPYPDAAINRPDPQRP